MLFYVYKNASILYKLLKEKSWFWNKTDVKLNYKAHTEFLTTKLCLGPDIHM